MKTWLVSRHSGAKAWILQQGIKVDVQAEHLDTSLLQDNDIVVGTLPIQIVAELNARSIRYLHLEVSVPAELRGKELSMEQLNALGATLSEFSVKRLP